jgi:hypothetical protein
MVHNFIEDYKKILVQFLAEMVRIFPEEGEITLIKFFIENLPASATFNMFNTLIHKNNDEIKNMIRSRNDDFILKCSTLGFAKNKMKHFQDIWKSERVDNDTKDTIWEWIDTLVKIIDKYNKIV